MSIRTGFSFCSFLRSRWKAWTMAEAIQERWKGKGKPGPGKSISPNNLLDLAVWKESWSGSQINLEYGWYHREIGRGKVMKYNINKNKLTGLILLNARQHTYFCSQPIPVRYLYPSRLCGRSSKNEFVYLVFGYICLFSDKVIIDVVFLCVLMGKWATHCFPDVNER